MNDQVYLVLNTTAMVGSSLCGILHRYVQGQNQLVFDRVQGATEWAIKEVAPPPPDQAPGTTQQTRRDFLPYSLYFGLQGNHIVILQSMGLAADHLADYLIWLIRDKSGLAIGSQHLSFDLASSTRMRSNGLDAAKAISITKDIADLVLKTPQPGSKKRKPYHEKVVNPEVSTAATTMLNAMGVTVPSSLKDPDAKDLQIYIEIRKPYSRSEEGDGVINELAENVIRDDDNYRVILQNNGVVSGKNLKLTKPIKIEIKDGSTHPSPISVFKQIDSYLSHLIAKGVV